MRGVDRPLLEALRRTFLEQSCCWTWGKAATIVTTRLGTASIDETARQIRAGAKMGGVARAYHVFRRGGYSRFGNQNDTRRAGGSFPHWISNPRNQRLLFIGATASAAVYISSRQEIPYTHRHHAILVDVDTEKKLGEETFRQILNDARRSNTLLSPRHPASLVVRRVGKRIAAIAGDDYGGGFTEQMKEMDWEFAVIKSNDVNAFVVPGGKVVVYTGLLDLVSSEDELAAVLAHEVAHIVARHAAERMTQGSVIELVRMIAYLGFGIPLFSGPLQALFFLPNSRQAETEADTIGVQLAARACYDPMAAARVFRKLGEVEKQSGMQVPEFLRTHPCSDRRVDNIRSLAGKAHMIKEDSNCRDDMFGRFFS
jgi:predicted Zn-dependent protease